MSKAKKAKKATKSKVKKADPLANVLAWEKKTMDTYKKMEADATKKDDKMLMKLFGDLRKDAENHIKKIENTREKIKKAKAGKKTWF